MRIHSCHIYLSPPRLYTSNRPEIYTFGLNEENASIVLYEKCLELNEDELHPILAHELAHVKHDVKYLSLRYLWEENNRRYGFLPSIVLSIVMAYACVSIYMIGSSTPKSMGPEEQVTVLINRSLPYLFATLNLSVTMATKIFLEWSTFTFRRPAPEIDEFKADLVAYLTLNDASSLINSLSIFRRLQIKYYLETLPSTSKTSMLRKIYNRFMEKGVYAREYSSWLDYFKESMGKLMITLGKGFDYPRDKLRKDFIKFIDKLLNGNLNFSLKKENIKFNKLWALKTLLTNDSVALYSWLQEEIYYMNPSHKEKVIDYLKKHLKGFNAKVCSSKIDIPLYEVIIVILTALVDEAIDIAKV